MGYDRTKRAAMAEQLAQTDPEAYQELLALRRYNPQGYRKQLRRLLRQGVVSVPAQAESAPPKAPTPRKTRATGAPKAKAEQQATEPAKGSTTKARSTRKKAAPNSKKSATTKKKSTATAATNRTRAKK